MKLDRETRMTISVLARNGQSGRAIARIVGVDESTVRYHLRREAAGAVDGRSQQVQQAASLGEAIAHFMTHAGSGPVNVAAMLEWLQVEHGFTGSLRGLQRYIRRSFPKPAKRARRRVETPPGAQAQADWAEWPRVWIAGRPVVAHLFHLRLSFSRYGARVWSPREDQLAWHHVHNEGFRRLGGVSATVRIDNLRTAVSHGAGAWGELNASYRRYARAVRFHIDPCPVRSPQAKGKVERGIGADRAWREVTERDWSDWSELQAWTDARVEREAHARMCPATGTSVWAAWHEEQRSLAPLPLLPEPFDLVATRTVAHDCTVAFEARRYSVPFARMGGVVTVHGCSQVVQVWHDGRVIAQHPRRGRERVVIDPRHYEGDGTTDVLPPLPLGRMGRKLQAIAEMAPQRRPIDLYAALAEVAR